MSEANSIADTLEPSSAGVSGAYLDINSQRRNAGIFAAVISLTYLSSPVIYVGIQAGLCKRLNASDATANLASAVFAAMAWFPVVVAWLFPQARLLRKTMKLTYIVMSLSALSMALIMILNPSAEVIIGCLIFQAALLGGGNGIVSMLNWETLHRGLSAKFKGKALGLAFGIGPVFAVVGALFTQLLMDGNLFGWEPELTSLTGYPYSYAIVFSLSAACMALSALLAHFYRIPLPKTELKREPFNTAVFSGFRSMVNNRVLFIACLAYLLVYCGNMIQSNMNLFTQESVGRAPEDLVGYQLSLRFSFKIAAGFLLGWLLIRTNPKVPLLVTAGFQIAGILWALIVPGYWFMLAFGLMGAGELSGVYYMNYPVSCSPKSQVRRNIAFLGLISSLVGISPVFYGWLSDTWSLRVSFAAALVILVFTAAMVWIKLPARPHPRPEDLSAADLND